MKIAIYVRVSTEEQVKEGYSIETQKEKLKAYCISQGWKNFEFFIDEGISAKDTNRPALQHMFRKIESGAIQVVLVYKLDRLTRSVKDLYEILEMLERYNCKFKSATEVFDTTTAIGRLFITMVSALAQWERENTAERVRVVMEQKVVAGHWKGGVLPYGYDYIDKEIVINEEEAEAVRYIFDKIKTTGAYTVAKELTDLGYQTRNGDIWHMHTVKRIARNKFYAGYQSFGENIHKGNHPAIITEKEYENSQEAMDSRKGVGAKGKTSSYLFTGILICAECGSRLAGHRKQNGTKSYRCARRKSSGGCKASIITEKTIEKWLLDNMDEICKELTEPMTFDIQQNNVMNFQALEKELKQVRKLMDKHKKMFEADIIDIDELQQKIKQFRDREKEINDLLSKKEKQSEKQAILQETVSIFDDVYPHATDDEKKFLMTNLFEVIVLKSKGEYSRHKSKELVVSYIK